MPKGENSGGRMPPSQHGRPAQAPGEGKNSKRHDLERRDTPYLHGSDLQSGDVGMLESGVRQMNKRVQQSAKPKRAAGPTRLQGSAAPDPMEFLAGKETPTYPHSVPNGYGVENWQPIVRSVANSPQASPLLRRLFIRQLRNVQLSPNPEFYYVDLGSWDRALSEE